MTDRQWRRRLTQLLAEPPFASQYLSLVLTFGPVAAEAGYEAADGTASIDESAAESSGVERIPFDVDAYVRQVQSRPCFICAIVAGQHDSELEQVVAADDENIAFLARYPTLRGTVIVAPKAHREHVVRDLTEDAYLRLMALVYRMARAVETVVPTERIYLLSLGSQQGNAHLHWHIAPLPPGVPYRSQQFHALMAENGVLPWRPGEAVGLAAQLRAAVTGSG